MASAWRDGVACLSMARQDTIRELEQLRDGLDEYARVLGDIGTRTSGEGWFAAASDDERRRVDQLRSDLTQKYGALHDVIVEAHGTEPIIAVGGIVGGDTFLLALADPADNPWLDALDLSRQAVARAIGYQRMRRSGRSARAAAVVYRECKEWARILSDAVARIVRPS